MRALQMLFLQRKILRKFNVCFLKEGVMERWVTILRLSTANNIILITDHHWNTRYETDYSALSISSIAVKANK